MQPIHRLPERPTALADCFAEQRTAGRAGSPFGCSGAASRVACGADSRRLHVPKTGQRVLAHVARAHARRYHWHNAVTGACGGFAVRPAGGSLCGRGWALPQSAAGSAVWQRRYDVQGRSWADGFRSERCAAARPRLGWRFGEWRGALAERLVWRLWRRERRAVAEQRGRSRRRGRRR